MQYLLEMCVLIHVNLLCAAGRTSKAIMTYKRGKRGGAKQRAKQQAATERKQEGNSTADTSQEEKEGSEADVDLKIEATADLDTSQDLDESKTEAGSTDKKDGAEDGKGGKKEEAGGDKRIVPLMDVDVSRLKVTEITPFVVENMRGR